jgi:N6-L-threonylcarbamoyladenine synthase
VRVLGIESSCDETAAAVVERDPQSGRVRILSNLVASQVAIHAQYGGVVPEVASRAHLETIIPTVTAALQQAGFSFDDLDGLAVTHGPGLVGALLVGVETARALSYATGKPLVGVNHLAGHLAAVHLYDDSMEPPAIPPWPHLALLVSGGHTALFRVQGHGDLTALGATRDDAAGEAYDKVGKLLGLGYPAGAKIDLLAATGNPSAHAFPRALPGREDLEFSFSGLKTAVATRVEKEPPGDPHALADLCASFQAAVVDVLVRKTRKALQQQGLHHLVVAGGVAANQGLRQSLAAAAQVDGFTLYIPRVAHCTDNAAMIAAEGAALLQKRSPTRADLLALTVDPGLPIARASA